VALCEGVITGVSRVWADGATQHLVAKNGEVCQSAAAAAWRDVLQEHRAGFRAVRHPELGPGRAIVGAKIVLSGIKIAPLDWHSKLFLFGPSKKLP